VFQFLIGRLQTPEREIRISQGRKWEIIYSLPKEVDEIEFVSIVLSIVAKIDEITKGYDDDTNLEEKIKSELAAL